MASGGMGSGDTFEALGGQVIRQFMRPKLEEAASITLQGRQET